MARTGKATKKQWQHDTRTTPPQKSWLVFTLNVKWWILQTVTYFFKITPKELRDNLASISNLCYLTYFSSYSSLCEIFYMDRSMVMGKLQYVQVQMLLGNRALCKYMIFYTESMLPTYTGCCNGLSTETPWRRCLSLRWLELFLL